MPRDLAPLIHGLALEQKLIRMTEEIKDFRNAREVVKRLYDAGYSHIEVMEHSGEAVRRELLRRKVISKGDR